MVGTSAIVAFLTRKTVDGAAQCGDGADDHGASRHLDSVSWAFLGGDWRERAAVPALRPATLTSRGRRRHDERHSIAAKADG